MKFLIVTQRYLGDSLVAASLAPAIKTHFPDAQVDLLTFRQNTGILEGVDVLDHVIGVERRPNRFRQALDHLASRNRYDWALITMNSTRSVLYGWAAARRQVMARPGDGLSELWRRVLITDQIPPAGGHKLDMFKPLLDHVLGGESVPLTPVCPDRELTPELDAAVSALGPYVVCHCRSRYRDKNWSDEKWRELFARIIAAGKSVCLTGGPGEAEELRTLTEGLPEGRALIIAGRASFGQTARIIRGAVAYVGVDTATSHVAAATGTACICLFGPTSVRRWGPVSPKGLMQGFRDDLDIQTLNGVTVVRRDDVSKPCSGCGQHRCAHYDPPELSLCMQSICVGKVWRALCERTPFGA